MDSRIQKTIEAYGKLASQYSDYTFEKISQFNLTQFMSMLKGKKILDAGCGSGRDTDYFKEESFDVTGVDISPGMIAEAKKRAKGDFRVMDMAKLEFDDESFDGLWCCATMTHVLKKDAPDVLKGFHRVLKKDGVLYFSVKDGEGEKIGPSKSLSMTPVFKAFYKQQEVEDISQEAGFTLVQAHAEEGDDCNWIHLFFRK